MQEILNEFLATMERIKNNFFFSLMSVNFLSIGNFRKRVETDKIFSRIFELYQYLQSVDKIRLQEFEQSVYIHFLEDMLTTYERYSYIIAESFLKQQCNIGTDMLNKSSLQVKFIEKLPNIYKQEDMVFIEKLRKFRNKIMSSNNSVSWNDLIYPRFDSALFKSFAEEAKEIESDSDILLWIHGKINEIVSHGNKNINMYYGNFKDIPINRITMGMN